MSNNTQQESPIWYQDYYRSFLASEAHGFLLYGDVHGLAHENISHRGFLIAQLAKRRSVILCYDVARGITFPDPTMREDALALLNSPSGEPRESEVDPFESALAQIGNQDTGDEPNDPFAVNKPIQALRIIERLLRAERGKGQVAVLIEYADALCPPTQKAMMQPEQAILLVLLQTWARDSSLGARNNPFFLLTRSLEDVHADLRRSSAGLKAVEIAYPTAQERLTYLTWYLDQREKRNRPITLLDLDREELSRLTAGLNLRNIEDILLLGAKGDGITRSLVKARKDAIIATENSEVAEMLEPLQDGFRALGGMEKLIAWSKAEIIEPIRTGAIGDAPKGVLLVGPPGSGKCITGDSLVITNKGIMPICDIPRHFYVDPGTYEVAGLRVQSVTIEGQTVQPTVSHWWDVGESDTYRIKTEVGLEIEGTPEHPLLVVMPDGTFQWKSLEDLQVGDWLPVKRGDGVFGYDATLDEETAYIFGLLIGDGNLTWGGHIRLTSMDQELIDAFKAYIETRYAGQQFLHRKYRSPVTVKRLNSLDYTVQAWQVKAEFIRKGLSTALAFEKTVPLSVLHASQTIQAAFLRGLFDADGGFSKGIFEYGTSSKDLARQVSAMLWNLGIAHIVGCRHGYDGRPRESLRIHISGMGLVAFQKYVGFRLARKAKRLQEYLEKTRIEDSRNTLDRLPHLASLVNSAITEFGPSWNDGPTIRKMMYTAARGPYATVTRGTLTKIVAYGRAKAEPSGPILTALESILQAGLFFTQVTKKSVGRARVYDLTVPETHSFVANSLINHNTYFARALAREIGFNAVSLNLENILGSLVGESERKLQQFFNFARALAPVLVFLDELDQSDVSRRGNSSGNPVAANLFSAMLRFMGDETLRGKVIFLFASNRPDLIDPAMMRSGRIDAIIPVRLPGEAARYGIVLAQARTQQIAIDEDAARAIAAFTKKYSAADLMAIVKKARKLTTGREPRRITLDEATRALKSLKPSSPQLADWYTMLAVRACSDTDLLDEDEAALKDDPRALQSKIKELQPQETMREERSY